MASSRSTSKMISVTFFLAILAALSLWTISMQQATLLSQRFLLDDSVPDSKLLVDSVSRARHLKAEDGLPPGSHVVNHSQESSPQSHERGGQTEEPTLPAQLRVATSEVEAKLQAQFQAELKASLKARAAVEAELQSQLQAEREAKAVVEAKLQAQLQAEREAKNEVEAKYQSQLQGEGEAKAEVKATLPAQLSAPRPKYYELKDEIKRMTLTPPKGNPMNQKTQVSSYLRATVVDQAPWFPKRKMCKETCCVESVAVSLDQDKRKIINTRDGRDLSDLWVQHLNFDKTQSDSMKHDYHGTSLNEELLPCLVPGTVIWIENHKKAMVYFFQYLRPKIQVPYTLIVSGSDGDPFYKGVLENNMADPLLQKVYGTNPLLPDYTKTPEWASSPARQKQFPVDKFQGMNLGLSSSHSQETHLLPYLHLTNYSNPFSDLDKEKFNLARHPLQFEQDIFVHFGLRRPKRRKIWDIVCANPTTNGMSCHQNTETVPIHDILTGMSKYRFVISPPGAGWDCYRTYEALLLGVIPVIEARDPEGYDLFEGLPVVHMPKMSEAKTKQDFVDAIQKYIESDAFQKASFEKGWEKLFLQYRRRQLLRDTGRDREIVVDDNGKEYYQAFQYHSGANTKNVGRNNEATYCMKSGDCELPAGHKVDMRWMNSPSPNLSNQDLDWLGRWKKSREWASVIAPWERNQ